MNQSSIISGTFIAIGAIVIIVLLIGRNRDETICENIRDKEEGSVYCWRCKSREPMRKVSVGVDGKTTDGTAFRFVNIYTYKHSEPFEAYIELDGTKIKKLMIGRFPGTMYSATEDE